MSLRDLIHTDVAEVFLNAEDFGETFWYCPADGTKRRIVGVADKQIEHGNDQRGKFKRTILQLFCSRDPTTGIDDPKLGDAVWYVSDESDQGFAFFGMADDLDSNDDDENAHTLVFHRTDYYKIGGTRQPG